MLGCELFCKYCPIVLYVPILFTYYCLLTIIAVYGGHKSLFVEKSFGRFYKFISEVPRILQLRRTTFIHSI